MLLLENYPALRQLLETLGLTVFHTLWSGCLLLVLLVVVLKIIPASLAKVRFTVSLLTLQLLLLLFIAIFFQQWNRVATTAEPAVSIPWMPTPTEEAVVPIKPVATVPDSPSTQAVNWLAMLHRWSPWWAALWLLGCMVHALQVAQGLRYTHRLRVQAQPLSGKWERQFNELKQRLGMTKSVAFLASCQATVPLTFGWLKPVVLLPASVLMQLSPGQVEMIVLHELAHIRQHDYLWSLCQSVAEVVLFYHPAYWYISRMLEREREFACDQMALDITRQPHLYARTLLQLASTPSPAYGLPASGKRGLSARVRRIVTPTNGQRNVQVLPVLMLVGLLGLASVTFALQLQQSGIAANNENQEKPVADSTDRDYGPSFEEVMRQLSNEVLDTTNLTLDEIYENALTIDQYLNQFVRSVKEYIASHPEAYKNRSAGSPVNYSSSDVLYLIDGQVRNPKAIRQSDVDEISVFSEPEKANVKGIDISGYSVIVKASTKKGKNKSDYSQASDHTGRQLYLRNGWGQITQPDSLSTSQHTSPHTERWLYIIDDQVQTTRPTLLDQDYQKGGWKTRIVPGSSWWIKAHLTEEQQALVGEYKYTGIVFITSQDYRATQPAHRIHGTVTRYPGELAVPNLTVRIRRKGIATTTDANGYYQLAATNGQDTVEFLLDGLVSKVPINYMREVDLIATGKSKDRMQKTLKNIEQKLPPPDKRDSIHPSSKRLQHQTGSVKQPLFVVDGWILNDDDRQNMLSHIDAINVKNVEVLKGAPAMALYGTPATHGVVLITTHRGRSPGHRSEPPQELFDSLDSFRQSQPVLLTGQVYNWFTSEYVPGVKVVASGSTTTVTNADGRYQLRFPSGTRGVSLAFSAPGYPTHEMAVDMTGKEHFHTVMSLVREEEKAKIEDLQTKPTQDSVATNALFVVDGVPIHEKAVEELNLDPQNIRSIEVLSADAAQGLPKEWKLEQNNQDVLFKEQDLSEEWKAAGYDHVVFIETKKRSTDSKTSSSLDLKEQLHIFPNPTRQQFTLRFQTEVDSPITITVVDDQGQPFTTLTNRTYPAGSHEVSWDASEQKPGVYFVQWTVGEQRVTRKVVVE